MPSNEKVEQAEQVGSRALISGTIAAAAVAFVAALAGRRETGSYAAPLNATSHILWGEDATWRNRATLKYTATGLLLTHGATLFWASLYEKLFGAAGKERPRSPLAVLAGATLVGAGAYLTDYHLVPQRLTPGYERRVSGRALAAIFGALVLGLAGRDLAQALRAR